MPDFLLELYSEEIPARVQRKATEDLKKNITDSLVEAGLTYAGARQYWTPRRLSLSLHGLSRSSPAIVEERRGPRVGADQKVIDGFLRSTGLKKISDAEIRKNPQKGDIYLATIKKPGRLVEEILEEVVSKAIRRFPWSQSMRWSMETSPISSFHWIRPLQSILCILIFEDGETKVIDTHIEGIPSGNITYGHRFHAPNAIKVQCLDDYVNGLGKAKVLFDPEHRRNIILNDARQLVFAAGLELVEDDDLLEEISGLVEWVQVLIGSFDEKYLCLPEEVVRLTIKTHQKCFVTRMRQGKLANHFVIVSNIQASDGGEEIIRGNNRVVCARLADALHFWNCDQEDLLNISDLEKEYCKKPHPSRLRLDFSKPLDQRMAKLDMLNVVFHAKIGTQGERVRRIQLLAQKISKFTKADIDLVDRAGALAKADLCTEIVGEFPELQGKIGAKYAFLQGEDASVVLSIEEHLKPRGPSETIPKNTVSVTLALADKLDMLINFWAIDEKPSSSKDPYALRRAALGVIRILLENSIYLPLSKFIEDPSLISFFYERLKQYLRETGIRPDLIKAILLPESDDLLMTATLIEHFNDFLNSEKGAKFLLSAKRIVQILASEEKKGNKISVDISPNKFSLKAEKELHKVIVTVDACIKESMKTDNFYPIEVSLSSLCEPVDAFFEEVLVNTEDREIRENRLALLGFARKSIRRVIDLQKIF
ncbi:glycine--tRNA ligase subunit beta [Candidatus Liberibacter sp.]|uniref:glycine--tRNA ligase subunit beta n=1 Tax=Candidatus Liberibacter sp. TaxID=34022 RepID=UPI0015F67E30|nr:glycine--tRNA ligase subunit beta [Candidatus Liberibacter sp.]MBA5724508.1 glycine--tRNA ligase subunit beta [Candidatus Liberibacter sp.]